MDATPAVQPAPAKPVVKPGEWLTPLSIFALAGVLAVNHFFPNDVHAPDRAINAVALGKAYAPTLSSTYADGWIKAAEAIESGKSIAEAQKALQDSWKEARTAAFTRDVTPGFSLVLPEGTEPGDPAKRQQVGQLWRDFAKGLKGGK